MATPEQRRAQRATAARVRAARETRGRYTPVVPRATRARAREGQTRYAYRVIAGTEPMPADGTPESRQLARMASYAKYNKADPAFLAAFAKFFYHKQDQTEPEEDEDDGT